MSADPPAIPSRFESDKTVRETKILFKQAMKNMTSLVDEQRERNEFQEQFWSSLPSGNHSQYPGPKQAQTNPESGGAKAKESEEAMETSEKTKIKQPGKPQMKREQLLDLLRELTANVKGLSRIKTEYISQFQSLNAIIILREYLRYPETKIRTCALSFFRVILQDKAVSDLLNSTRTSVMIARSIEQDAKNFVHEVIEGLKLFKRWLQVSPSNIPKLLANCVVMIAENHEMEQIKLTCLELTRMLALANPRLCIFSRGLKILIEGIIDPKLKDSFQSLVYTMLFILDDPEKRAAVKHHLDIPKLFSPFIGNSTVLDKQGAKKEDQSYFLGQLKQSEKAIVTFLKSWSGVIYLGHEKKSVKALVSALTKSIHPEIRKGIFSIISQVFDICLKYIEPQDPVTGTLGSPFKVQKLMNSFAVVLLLLFQKAGLFEALLVLAASDFSKKSQNSEEEAQVTLNSKEKCKTKSD
jgi:Rapamycin-insensitive companion of mTOR, N-term